MNDINSYINEVKRDHEAIEIIETVERSVAAKRPARFTEYGRLVIDGVVKLVDPEENSNRPKPRYVFFFEKVLMVCKQRANNAYDYKRAYMLQEFEVSEVEPESAYKTNTIGRKLTASFFDNTSLTLNKRNLKVGDQALQIVMQFKSLQQRDQWKKALKEAIEKVDPPEAKLKGHQLTYFTYTLAATCTLCTKLLAGKFYQGYRCYNCRRDFHRECAGLRDCTSRASSSRISSTLPITRRMQNGDADHGLVKPHDRVVARQSIQSPDHNVLSFDAGDIIEVVHVNNPASFIGRLASSPGKSGLVAVDSVHKPGTLRPPLPTPNRTSQNSLPDMNGERPVSLVSSRIIDFTTDVADDMAEQPWYFGDMERREAEEKLVNTDTGTFLVRRSNHHDQFVISISVRSSAKHIKIYREEHVFYLHDGKMFNSIV
ncbi:variant SH3 domain-containing protein, partial [Aphelenchoides avenae]